MERQLIILSGLSGAGKTTALQALEDLGFFAVDNLPPSLWAALAERAAEAGESRIVICVDIRTGPFLAEAAEGLEALRAAGFPPTVLFLTASDETLVKRYNFTRRTHPLGDGSLMNEIAAERVALGFLRRNADRVIDTSDLSARQLLEALSAQFGQADPFRLRLVSFGYKRGVPIDADVVLDVRSLANPYYRDDLRPLPGTDPQVQAHVFTPTGLDFYRNLRNLTRSLAELAQLGGRSSYTVAIGCTGGQHRSVAVVERLGFDLAEHFGVRVEHRDLDEALEEHGP